MVYHWWLKSSSTHLHCVHETEATLHSMWRLAQAAKVYSGKKDFDCFNKETSQERQQNCGKCVQLREWIWAVVNLQYNIWSDWLQSRYSSSSSWWFVSTCIQTVPSPVLEYPYLTTALMVDPILLFSDFILFVQHQCDIIMNGWRELAAKLQTAVSVV